MRESPPASPPRLLFYKRLARSDLASRNLLTGEVTRFTVTHDPAVSESGLPVQISFQPNFWVGIELTFDDTADVPADPAADLEQLGRMRRICGTAIGS